jgi:prolyl oligopeptidase
MGWIFVFILGLVGCGSVPVSPTKNAKMSERAGMAVIEEDSLLWLEEIESSRVMDWVNRENARAVERFESDPRFAGLQAQLKDVLSDKNRIAWPTIRGRWIYNFWQDEKNPRGLWRRTSFEEYRKDQPKWDLLLDLDALKKTEKEEWVWAGSSCQKPLGSRCLVWLSRGGKDAKVVREFDLETKKFVTKGFQFPEAMTFASWLGEDALLVATDFGAGSLSQTGYPLQVRLVTRGEDFKRSRILFTANAEDNLATANVLHTPQGKVTLVSRHFKFFHSEAFEVLPDNQLQKVNKPDDATLYGIFEGQWILSLRSDWKTPAGSFKRGSLVSMNRDDRAGESVKVIWTPHERSSFQGAVITRDALYVDVSEHVQGKVLRVRWNGRSWDSETLTLPASGTTGIVSADELETGVFMSFQSLVQPSSLYEVENHGSSPGLLKSQKPLFDAGDIVVEQKQAKSSDGTLIPYFIVRKKDLPLDSSLPTLLYGYGGFEIPMDPGYSPKIGKAWLERGGVYVLANIRGGGEFGPGWHQAALRENRQRAFDDFYAVAEDLIRAKVTSPKKIGIMGGSNGGLLVGVAMTQRPDLFGAVVCQVPLLDMMRFDQLLAGKFWVDEYGSPADPKMRKVILTYSPYQNLRADQKYPEPFITTSTKDDRVHPGHARKMVERMRNLGHPVIYYENILGGHAAAADFTDEARRSAYEYIYLMQKLMP